MPIHDNMGFIKEKLNKFLSFFQTAVQNLSRPPSQSVQMFEDKTPPRHKSPIDHTSQSNIQGIKDMFSHQSCSISSFNCKSN